MNSKQQAEFEAWIQTHCDYADLSESEIMLALDAYQAAFDLAQAQNDKDLRALVNERARADRLQRILDNRPAINAGLPQAYIEWTQKVYIMDASHARETSQ